MKLGVFTAIFDHQPLESVLDYLQTLGVQAVELGCGGTAGRSHADPALLLGDPGALQSFRQVIDSHHMEISALSCHGNPVHPNPEVARAYDETIRNTILLAEKLGIHQINTFSGCPGSDPDAHYPNWVTCPWPEDFQEVLDYQWNQVLIPYWKKTAAFAATHGVSQIALEMHPGFCVYNPETLLRLREAVGNEIGANLDPSHLIWQGMDPVAVIRALKGAIFHFHAKDTKIDPYNTAVNGVLDTKPYGEQEKRSWIFRSVGYGNDRLYWKDIISNLRLAGYDHVVSVEHEDGLMSQTEGLAKACEFLKDIIIHEKVGTSQ